MTRGVVVLLSFLCLVAVPAVAYQGLSVSTPFPSIHISDPEMITFDLEVRNYDLSPQRVDLEIVRIPKGWEYSFVGGGGIVDAVFVEVDDSADVQLWVEPPQDLPEGSYDIVIRARGNEANYQLPLTIRSGGNLPQRLALAAELPSVRGTPDSDFTYEVEVRNNSTREVLVNLDAQTPRGFQVVFKERYGNKELSTLPIEAGEKKTVKVEVSPPQGISEGVYEVRVIARTDATEASTLLNMDIKGQPEIELYGLNERLSGSAVAGREQTFTLTVENTGSASARNLELSSSSPRNWSVEFETESIDELPAGESREVKAMVTPSSEAVAGDYNVTFMVRSDMGSISEKFRITVRTSTLWGIVAVLIIAAAALILVMAVRRFGRR